VTYWTVTELVERKLLPRGRLRDAVRSGALPATFFGPADGEILVALADLDWWVSDERAASPWVDEWLQLRQRRSREVKPWWTDVATTNEGGGIER
jgi:hypothetical protein